MDTITLFLALSAAIALLELFGTFKILIKDEIEINWAMGLIESTWFIISCLALWKLNLTTLEQAVAIVFIANILSTSITLTSWFNRSAKNTENGFVLPQWAIYFGLLLEISYFSLSAWALFNHQPAADALSFSAYLSSHISTIILVLLGIVLIVIAGKLIYLKGLKTLNDDVKSAIEKHPVCFETFGHVISIQMDNEITEDYEEENVFAYNVTGEKASALLVAEIETNIINEEEIIQGFIEFENGEIINFDSEKNFEA